MKIPVLETDHSFDIQLVAHVFSKRSTVFVSHDAITFHEYYGTEWCLPKDKLQTFSANLLRQMLGMA